MDPDPDKVGEIEGKIAELKRRWPSHSVPTRMWQELERLEDELEEARGRDIKEKHAGEDSPSGLPQMPAGQV